MRITLDVTHTHAGEEFPPKKVLDLNSVDAEWLLSRSKAHRTSPADLAQHANAIVPAAAGPDSDNTTMRAADDAGALAGA